MFRPRVIPVLLLKNAGLVKSKNFKNHKYIGDPINTVKIFNDLKADELIFLDINASRENRKVSLDFVKNIGSEANMPFGVGGGIKSINDIREICYMYYMNHKTSLELQRYIVDRLSDHLVLPNDIRYKIVTDIADINHKYRYSYRKPIFLETIIYCLFKHLEHYNINHELL